MARLCTWCEKKIHSRQVVREVAIDRTESPRKRFFHVQCWFDFVGYVFGITQ